jgi:hypothetical protein
MAKLLVLSMDFTGAIFLTDLKSPPEETRKPSNQPDSFNPSDFLAFCSRCSCSLLFPLGLWSLPSLGACVKMHRAELTLFRLRDCKLDASPISLVSCFEHVVLAETGCGVQMPYVPNFWWVQAVGSSCLERLA